jgi:hypothetical protein
MRANLAHGRFAEADLTITAGKMPSDYCEDGSASDGCCLDGRQSEVVDGDLCDKAVGDRGDSFVMFKAS